MPEPEILLAVDQLQSLLADLVVRGLRSAGPAQLAPLNALREEFERIGAGHLASRLFDLLEAIKQGDHSSAPALMRAQTSVRLFERILTLEHAENLLSKWAEQSNGEPQ